LVPLVVPAVAVALLLTVVLELPHKDSLGPTLLPQGVAVVVVLWRPETQMVPVTVVTVLHLQSLGLLLRVVVAVTVAQSQ
jgi:hypothetical protein